MNDSWVALRRFTQARIALGRAGHAVPTQVLLDFQLAHAKARDAVHVSWNIDAFAGLVRDLGEEVLILDTPIGSRDEYIRRPDLGRVLTEGSRTRLRNSNIAAADAALIVTNGLSSTAVERHGIPLLQAITNAYRTRQLRIAPVSLAANGRVALSDDIGSVIAARVAVIIVGERPGLSAADSLGIYLTYAPKPGTTDAKRNCISNIRPPEGLSYEAAAAKLLYLTEEAIRRSISGVELKDEMTGLPDDGENIVRPPKLLS
ncbi:MAG TPA: ethanolamine ammonia-lyase subunit EutC [Nitrospirota bacterium]|nr:ethanolamine ammonia-lyase subunit EutC [Nitrospirota bacterium]